MEAFEPPKYLASLIAAVNDGAKSAQASAFLFLLVGLYLLATVLSAITPGDCWSADVMATIPDVEGGEARCVARIADRQRSRSGLSAPRKAIAGSVVWIARSSSTNGAVVC
jgi:hypothetical protein